MYWREKRYSFYVSITTLLMVTVLVLAGIFLWVSYRESRTAAIQNADHLFSEVNAKTIERYENALKTISLIARLASSLPGFDTSPIYGEIVHPSMEYMLKVLAQNENIYSTYIGYTDGSFLQVIAMRNKKYLFDAFSAPPETAYIVRKIAPNTNGVLVQRWSFLDRHHQFVRQREGLDPGYDPRSRIWYQRAMEENTTFFTDPYVFSSNKIAGLTCAKQLASGKGVFGLDITLEQFALSLTQQEISVNDLLFLFDRSGKIIIGPKEDSVQVNSDGSLDFLAGEKSRLPTIRGVIADYLMQGDNILNKTREVHIHGTDYLVMLTGIDPSLKFNQILATIAPVSDFTGQIRRMQERILLICFAILIIFLPITLFFCKMISGSLTQLEVEAQKIRSRDFSESPPFDSNIKEIHTLIRAFTMMKKTIRHLLEQQRKLFDDFTKLIAGAIDAKSPYTGGHCARVPVVAEMLAKAARESKDGPFTAFDMKTEDELWEFEVAAWLHDCGKVTTPEYVVDKATKLETIYNRIHEIRMRFEVLLRDAEISYYQKLLDGNTANETLLAELEDEKKQIVDDFTFVAACNIGGELMADEKLDRLKNISSRTWMRYIDDRIGLSEDEFSLKNQRSAPSLPVEEKVIADQPWHIIPRDKEHAARENFDNFNMEIPQNQYNLGELYNLSIRKGTLSKEDRFKIQEHMIQTINMLNKLDFPEYLANVPEYAGAHHETMIGTGYPRGLKKEEMSVPARIMAIADIFEALTAADRPYKKPKKISDTLRIMSSMCKDKHIDADLFRLFLERGVFKDYADKYLDKKLIDTVNIDEYLPAKD